jgi:Na+/H+ antiporter NhaD/arsenite permease-like protein
LNFQPWALFFSAVYRPNLWIILPFGLLLLCMAVLPLRRPEWWERHYAKVSLFFAAVTLGYYLFVLPQAARQTVGRTAWDYAGFIILIGSLYVVAGGIHISVKAEPTPALNTAFLALGGLIANLLGTTGASMLLIRPWLRLNHYRVAAHHLVFFIFIVSNVGGGLTPIGDPPLLVGFVKGVPFWWVGQHCWPMWLCAMIFLLAVFYFLDRRNYAPSPQEVRAQLAETEHRLRFEGLGNTVFLAVIIASVFLPGPPIVGLSVMLCAASASYLTTGRGIHQANHFSFRPIIEVAVLFFGIFMTMMPLLDRLLNVGRNLSPGQVYWSSGALSGFLDSAPAYLAYFSAVLGAPAPRLVAPLLGQAGGAISALSVGTVMFGALTYLGNGPNLLIKSIADHQKIDSPSFLAYLFKWAVPLLVPLLIILWLLFFR